MPSSLLPFSLLPQNQIIVDDNKTLMASSSPNKPMDQIKPDPNPHPLKCPRCDSSNTKFCYYNNYSLSQPRHFCKACKRYWTRGGTLRNVPVGGGCRKNKRSSKRPTDPAPTAATATVQRPPLDLSTSAAHSNRIHNPLFYNPVELNFPFSGSRVLSTDTFDLHHSQMSGFSSGLAGPTTDHHHHHHQNNGFKPIQDPFNHNSIFFGSSNLTSSSAMASLLAMKSGGVVVPGLMPYDDPQMQGKDVKVEGWNPNPNQNQNQNQNPIEQISISSDPSNSLVWNSTWFDPSSMGSNSVPSLI